VTRPDKRYQVKGKRVFDMYDVFQAMALRESVRHYKKTVLTPHQQQAVITEANRLTATRGLLGQPVVLHVLFGSSVTARATYGVIRQAPGYFVGVCPDAREGLLDLGYLMEKLILYVTGLGFGTCWISGTFRAEAFRKWIPLAQGMKVAAVSPVGFRADRRTLVAGAFKTLSRSTRRKALKDMVFVGDFSRPYLKTGDGGGFHQVLEGVRAAPSGRNAQPWRILMEEGRGRVHFYAARSGTRYLDLGIALAHFALGAEALGLAGEFSEDPLHPVGPYEYILTFKH